MPRTVTAMWVHVKYVRSSAKTFLGRGCSFCPLFVSSGSSTESSSKAPAREYAGLRLRVHAGRYMQQQGRVGNSLQCQA